MEAATYAKFHLLCNIVQHPLFTKDVNKAIGEGIIMTDKNFCTKAEKDVCMLVYLLLQSFVLIICIQNLCSGTTAVVGMVADSHLHMGWTGDSQIILDRRGVPVFASQPHT